MIAQKTRSCASNCPHCAPSSRHSRISPASPCSWSKTTTIPEAPADDPDPRGAAVQVAESAPTAMRILAGQWPDIVISDIEMPGEDGYSLIRKIRLQEPPSQRVPAIALTAYTRSADRVRALAAGFRPT